MKASQKLEDIIRTAAEAVDFKLYGCELHPHQNRSTLVVYVDDKDGRGVTLDECATVSRQIAAALDVEDPISGHYDLQVSSPGMDRPLITLEHFERVIGVKVKLKLRIARDNQKNYSGTVTGVADGNIQLQLEDGAMSVPFLEIDRARLIPEY